jgi:hypothetical protein
MGVVVQQQGGQTIVLSKSVVATIAALKRDTNVVGGNVVQVVARDANVTPVDRPTDVTINRQGLQGPKGDPGVSGGGALPPINFSYGDAAHVVYTAPSNGVFTICRVDVSTAFNGTGAAIHVGLVGNIDVLIPSNHIDPTSVGGYEQTADYTVSTGAQVWLQIAPGAGATQGAGQLFLTFIPE